jgi:hypothetical protein
VIELVFTVTCFWDSDGASFRDSRKHQAGENPEKGGLRKILFTMPSARVTWICAVFLLGYVGIEVALGGWIVTFMKEVRHAAPFSSSMTSTGFWLGIAVGRIVLGFVTPLIGEKVAITVSPQGLYPHSWTVLIVQFNRRISHSRSYVASYFTWFQASTPAPLPYLSKASSWALCFQGSWLSPQNCYRNTCMSVLSDLLPRLEAQALQFFLLLSAFSHKRRASRF